MSSQIPDPGHLAGLDIEWPAPGEALFLRDSAYWIGVPIGPEDDRKYLLPRPAGPRSWTRPWVIPPPRRSNP